MNKNKHLISENLYKLLLACKRKNISSINWHIRKCQKELDGLKPRPWEIENKNKEPNVIKITRVSAEQFIKMLEDFEKCSQNTKQENFTLMKPENGHVH